MEVKIELPDEAAQRIREILGTDDPTALGGFVRELVERQLDLLADRASDPYLQPRTRRGSGHRDTAQEHDRYLYGGRR